MPGRPTTSRRALLRTIAAALLARAPGATGTPAARAASAASAASAATPVPADLATWLPDGTTLATLGLVETGRRALDPDAPPPIAILLPADGATDAGWRGGLVATYAPIDPAARFTTLSLALDRWPDARTAAAMTQEVAATVAFTGIHLPDHASVRTTLPGVTSGAWIDVEAELAEVIVVGYVASSTLLAVIAGGLDLDPVPASRLVAAALDLALPA